LSLMLDPSVKLVQTLTSYPFENPDGSGNATISLGDLFAEERRDVLVTLALSAAEVQGSQTLGCLGASGFSLLREGPEKVENLCLDIDRLAESPGHPIGSESHLHVVRHRLRYQATKAMENALVAANGGKLTEAQRILGEAAEALAARPPALQQDAICTGLALDVADCLRHMQEKEAYRTMGSKKLNCYNRSHMSQRACGQGDLSGTAVYQNVNMADMSMSFSHNCR